MNYLFLFLGFVVLIISGEVMVRGAAGLALKARISPLIVGLTVVSLGTSAPELFASLQALKMGSPEIAVGNVIGSNIANLGLVLGITTIIFPIAIDRMILRQDWPMMLVAIIAFYILGMDGELSFWDGALLFSMLIFFTGYLILRSKWQRSDEPEEHDEDGEFNKVAGKSYWILIVLIIAGGLGLYFGSEWFLKGAIGIAYAFNIPEHVVGATIIAFGTSIPELAASGVAAFRKQSDISIGNLVGSNIFNLFGVLGITSMVGTLGISPQVLEKDFFWMLGVALILFPIMFFGKKITRLNGLTLLLFYVGFVYFLVF